ncbi:MAG: UDP-N-acetylmuramate dehydrogenase [Deltaproteobacteria bacterium]|nr:UDP-N-acetylmuramate dehydrogenase [Deltaproteobacteria bacterium]MBW2476029.1 UDP-N-acetylmuramate dehydrogenase [Deltaproteobacteria bacterium]MBW2505107.1 UDP-N-acetylmuramate dehydrogenase [Deltaproteobacteria bacterium]
MLDVGRIQKNAPLNAQNTWRIGGPADLLIQPSTVAQVAAVVKFTTEKDIPLIVIGQGSNLLFDDAGLRGVVLKLGPEFRNVSISGQTVRALGGVWVPNLARRALHAGLAGLEHIIGIPGSLGGLVLMNGGSHRRGIGDHITRVKIVDRSGTVDWLNREECQFSYRKSALQDIGAIVVEVELVCPYGDRRKIRRLMLDDLRERRGKFPRKQPNCGSVFLSTASMHASVGPPGKIIEDAGLKGWCIGGAEVSSLHANFIVNRGNATSQDILQLIQHIRQTVLERIGFQLECEVRYVSPQGAVMPAHLAAPTNKQKRE